VNLFLIDGMPLMILHDWLRLRSIICTRDIDYRSLKCRSRSWNYGKLRLSGQCWLCPPNGSATSIFAFDQTQKSLSESAPNENPNGLFDIATLLMDYNKIRTKCMVVHKIRLQWVAERGLAQMWTKADRRGVQIAKFFRTSFVDGSPQS